MNKNFIKTLKIAIKNKQIVKYHKQNIDIQTANVILNCYKALNKTNKEKFLIFAENKLPKLINFCWSVV